MNGQLHSPRALLRWTGSQRRIGITGGIASGKSSVEKFLKEIKVLPIIDADVYAKEALAPGQKAANKVLKHYGNSINNEAPNRPISINRKALSQIIFQDRKERLWLENLIHPIIKRRINEELISQKN